MQKIVHLSFGSGSLEVGFPRVTAQLSEASEPHSFQFTGSLPPAPDIAEFYKQWQKSYLAIHQCIMPRQFKFENSNLSNVSIFSFETLSQNFAAQINAWLNSESFSSEIDKRLRSHLHFLDEIQFIIETDDNLLRRLPWHEWKLFSEYRLAEVALSLPRYQPPRNTTASVDNKVKILAVLGSSEGIDIEQDKAIIKQLPRAEPTFLVNPKPDELTDQLWEQEWKIIFFAGHSSSQADGKTGLIYINPSDSLSLRKLKNGLITAIERGLQLAIFNSCDGLGLARELADLQIPQIIIMREPVPDVVAQKFLKHFLRAFAQGKSLYLAMRSARERLEDLEPQFPCATWLPVICQNPATVSPTWSELSGRIARDATTTATQPQEPIVLSRRRHLLTVFLASVAATSLVMGMRYLGILQEWELQVFDHSLRDTLWMRPEETPDPRLLIVTITEGDLQIDEETKERKGSLPDRALAPLLRKLEQFEPVAIGLDVYRDFPVGPYQSDLRARMIKKENLFVVCKGNDPKTKAPGIKPPNEVEAESRIGFSDVIPDPDVVIRRYLLAIAPSATSNCPASYALSAQIASYYLDQKGFSRQYTPSGDFQIGKTIFKRLRPHTGPYQQVDTYGYQTLLNYRVSNGSPLQIAPIVTLTDILRGNVKAERLKGRIILVGTTATSFHDYLTTPYSSGQNFSEQMPGVILQAQAVSQIINAVEEHRPLLWFLPVWADYLWVFLWSLLGGMLGWRFRYPLDFRLMLAVLELCLCAAYLLLLFYLACWVPFVPSTIALVMSSSSVAFLNSQVLSRRQRRQF